MTDIIGQGKNGSKTPAPETISLEDIDALIEFAQEIQTKILAIKFQKRKEIVAISTFIILLLLVPAAYLLYVSVVSSTTESIAGLFASMGVLVVFTLIVISRFMGQKFDNDSRFDHF